MATESTFYRTGLARFLKGEIDVEDDTIMILLLKTAHAFAATDEFVADVDTDETAVVGYARKTIATIAVNSATANVYFDSAADETWASLAAGDTLASVVVYKFITDDDASPLICINSFGDKATDDGAFTIQWHANGIGRLANQGE